MTIKNLVRDIKKQLNRTLDEVIQERKHASGYEVGLRHPLTQSHHLLRDDGGIQTQAGATSILQDPSNGQITVKAPVISLDCQYLHLHTAPDGLYFGYQRFNPLWFSPPIDPSQGWMWRAAPLTQAYPGALYVNPAQQPNTYLSASPDKLPALAALGIVPIPFSSVFQATPLFTFNEEYTLLIKNLGSFISQLGTLTGE